MTLNFTRTDPKDPDTAALLEALKEVVGRLHFHLGRSHESWMGDQESVDRSLRLIERIESKLPWLVSGTPEEKQALFDAVSGITSLAPKGETVADAVVERDAARGLAVWLMGELIKVKEFQDEEQFAASVQLTKDVLGSELVAQFGLEGI